VNLIEVVIEVLIIGIINNGMAILGANPAVQRIVKGVITIGAVIVACMRRRT
jgi:ribose/xylose/arabinose/galactoside ABC-type transport system permease subunit